MKTCYLIVPVLVECCCEKWHTSAIGQYFYPRVGAQTKRILFLLWSVRTCLKFQDRPQLHAISICCRLLHKNCYGLEWGIRVVFIKVSPHKISSTVGCTSLLRPHPLLFSRFTLVHALSKMAFIHSVLQQTLLLRRGSFIYEEGVRTVLKAM